MQSNSLITRRGYAPDASTSATCVVSIRCRAEYISFKISVSKVYVIKMSLSIDECLGEHRDDQWSNRAICELPFFWMELFS